MWMINTEPPDDTETLCCHVCRTPFPALELARLTLREFEGTPR